jgi:hypothetical protein
LTTAAIDADNNGCNLLPRQAEFPHFGTASRPARLYAADCGDVQRIVCVQESAMGLARKPAIRAYSSLNFCLDIHFFGVVYALGKVAKWRSGAKAFNSSRKFARF